MASASDTEMIAAKTATNNEMPIAFNQSGSVNNTPYQRNEKSVGGKVMVLEAPIDTPATTIKKHHWGHPLDFSRQPHVRISSQVNGPGKTSCA